MVKQISCGMSLCDICIEYSLFFMLDNIYIYIVILRIRDNYSVKTVTLTSNKKIISEWNLYPARAYTQVQRQNIFGRPTWNKQKQYIRQAIGKVT